MQRIVTKTVSLKEENGYLGKSNDFNQYKNGKIKGLWKKLNSYNFLQKMCII